jgi:hypothetical protein
MFEHGECRLDELGHQVYRRVDVDEVVVRQLLAVQDIEYFVDIAVEIAFLMWIFAVAQGLSREVAFLERLVRLLRREIAVNQRVVVRADAKSLFGELLTEFKGGLPVVFIEVLRQHGVL